MLKEQLVCLPSESGPWDFTRTFYRVNAGRFNIRQYHEHFDVELDFVNIGELELADFPVTNAMFELFCPSHRRPQYQQSRRDDDPVVCISWYMATEFCDWLSALMGRHYRLPTEWEWEWACRWHDTLKEDFWWGLLADGDLCWHEKSTPTPKGERSRSEAIEAHQRIGRWHPSGRSTSQPGFLDLSGNAWEWCSDWFYAHEELRVQRGGCSIADGEYCRSGYRSANDATSRDWGQGFRLAAVLEPSKSAG